MGEVFIDCPTGLAGNMLLAALLDAGVPEETIHAPLAALGLADRYRLKVEERRSGGLRGLHVEVEAVEPEPGHRHWGELRPRLEAAPIDPRLRERVLAVFTLLAEAEAAVHGHAPDQVQFHEVGAIDALVDVVGVCAGLLHLGQGALVCGIPPAGHGRVSTAHGLLPLPAPAVLEIARRRNLPLAASQDFPAAELTTPTGLALMACWARAFQPMPAGVPLRVGVGLGSRRLDRPNLLRLVIIEPLATARTASDPQALECWEPLLAHQAQIDDATAEDLAFLAEALREAGAVEVFSQAIAMKKGRQGTLLTALMTPELGPEVRAVWWQHATTLGVREQLQGRWVLERELQRIETPLGEVRIKRARLPDGRVRRKPEHDDLAALARKHKLSLGSVRSLVEQAMAEVP